METMWPVQWGVPHEVGELVDGEIVHAWVKAGAQGVCQNCGDSEGFMYAFIVRQEARATHEFVDRNGRKRVLHADLQSRPCPVCRGGQMEEWILRNNGTSGMYVGTKVATSVRVVGETPKSGQEEAWAAAMRLLAELPDPKTWGLFVGGYGTGKTHLLMSMINAARKVGVLARYTTTDKMLMHLQSTFSDDASLSKVRDEYVKVPVLVLDEFHRIKWSEWAGQQVFAVLNERYTFHRPVWLGSNEGPEDLAEKAEPLAALMSRMREGEVAVFTNADMRSGKERDDWSDGYAHE